MVLAASELDTGHSFIGDRVKVIDTSDLAGRTGTVIALAYSQSRLVLLDDYNFGHDGLQDLTGIILAGGSFPVAGSNGCWWFYDHNLELI
jgi:hypothetical protein